MSRLLPPATELLIDKIEELGPFYAVLRRPDQLVLDDIFELVHQHQFALQQARNLRPLEALVWLVMLEEHKRINQLQAKHQKLAKAANG